MDYSASGHEKGNQRVSRVRWYCADCERTNVTEAAKLLDHADGHDTVTLSGFRETPSDDRPYDGDEGCSTTGGDERASETASEEPIDRTWEVEYGLSPEWACLFENES